MTKQNAPDRIWLRNVLNSNLYFLDGEGDTTEYIRKDRIASVIEHCEKCGDSGAVVLPITSKRNAEPCPCTQNPMSAYNIMKGRCV